MPLELGVWRIDQGLQPVTFSSLDFESRLEDLLEKDISIAAPHWMVIGRQVRTAYDSLIDLVAIDREGNLVILELKRDKTPRDIIAQILDYGSQVRSLPSPPIFNKLEIPPKDVLPWQGGLQMAVGCLPS